MKLGRSFDHAVGFVSQALHRPSEPHPDTLAHLEAYFELPRERMFPPPPERPALRVRRTLPHLGCRRQSLSGPSAHVPIDARYRIRHATDYATNQTLRARRMLPLTRKSRDLLVWVHGWMAPGAIAEELTLMPWGVRLFGADIVHLDLPFHGARKPRSSLLHGTFYWTADLVRTLEALRQSVMDVRTLVRWGRNEGYRRIGVAGVSLGGVVTMLTACAEPDLDWAAPLVAHLDLAAAVDTAPILRPMKRDLERFELPRERVAELVERIGLTRYPLAIERERLLVVAARDDVFLGPDEVTAQWERWGRPPIHWLPGGHMTIVPNMIPVWRRLARFARSLPPRHGA